MTQRVSARVADKKRQDKDAAEQARITRENEEREELKARLKAASSDFRDVKIIASGKLKELPGRMAVKFAWQLEEKMNVEGSALESCDGAFGTPSLVYAFRVADNLAFVSTSSGNSFEEIDFTPKPGNKGSDSSKDIEVEPQSVEDAEEADAQPEPSGGGAEDADVEQEALIEITPIVKGDDRKQDTSAEHRVLVATCILEIGSTFEHCESAWQVGESLLHSQLGTTKSPVLSLY
jgi:hypothetical protein